jgi:hypothetical protein
MIYRVEVHSGVSEYLRSLEGFTRTGRLNLCGFIDVLRNYGDEAREECPRQTPDSSIFRLRWTFDAGPAIRSVDFYIDDSQGGAGLLQVVCAELISLPERGMRRREAIRMYQTRASIMEGM